ncbi:MAG: hypothetical protein PHG19_00455 [Anaerotignum sp.]|nr:hypothetical protein [Anaerotignum sp.]
MFLAPVITDLAVLVLSLAMVISIFAKFPKASFATSNLNATKMPAK